MVILEILFLAAAGALVWMGFNRLTLAEPFKTILLVVIGLIFLFILWQLVVQLFGGGGNSLGLMLWPLRLLIAGSS
jgi:hypothetical protein